MLEDFKNFDQMKALAQNNPQALERLRIQQVEKIINSAPEHLRPRLRGLQFQIDCKRRTQTSPMGACIAISRMMHDSLSRLNDALNGNSIRQARPPKNSKVLSFPALS